MNIGGLMATLGVDSQLWKAEQDLRGFQKSAEASLTKVQSRMDKVGESMRAIGAKMTMFVTAPILAAGGYAFKMASDLTESLNKSDVAFKTSKGVVSDWSKNTLNSFGIAQGSALDMVSMFGDMSTSMGLSTSKAAEMSMSLVGLAGDIASFKNTSISEVQTSLAGIFTGETESLKRLGIVMTEVNVQEYALSKGITKKMEAMTQAEKVNLRYNYVMSVTKNSQGDFARTASGAANQMRTFTEGIKETAASFGLLLLPSITKGIAWVNSLVKSVLGMSENQKKWIIGILAAVAALGPLSFGIGATIKVVTILTTAVGGLTTAMAWLKVATLSNPFGAFIVGVTAVIGILKIYSNMQDRLTTTQKLANSIQSKAADSVVEEQVRTEQLVKTVNNLRLPYEMRNKALKDLQSISPQYLGSITEEEVRTGKATLAIREYITGLKNKAVAEAAYQSLVELEKKRLGDIKSGRDEQLTWYEKATKVGLIYSMGIDFMGQKEYENYYANLKFIKADKEYTDQKSYLNGIIDKSTFKTGQNTAALIAQEAAQVKATEAESKKQAALVLTQESMKRVTEAQKTFSAGLTQISGMQKLFGESTDTSSDKLGVYTAYIQALAKEGTTTGKVITDLKNRIDGLTGSTDKIKGLSGLNSITANSKTTKATGGAFGYNAMETSLSSFGDKALKISTAMAIQSNTGDGLTKTLGNMASVYQRVAVAQEQYQLQQEKTAATTFNLGNLTANVFQGMADVITNALNSTSNIFDAFGKAFLDMIKGIIIKLVAATIAAFALAVVLSALGIGGGQVFKALGSATSFGDTFSAGIKSFAGMADGGIVPAGYQNDTFPAMLSSGEQVIPAKNVKGLNGSGIGGKVVFEIEGRKLVGILSEMGKLNRSF